MKQYQDMCMQLSLKYKYIKHNLEYEFLFISILFMQFYQESAITSCRPNIILFPSQQQYSIMAESSYRPRKQSAARFSNLIPQPKLTTYSSNPSLTPQDYAQSPPSSPSITNHNQQQNSTHLSNLYISKQRTYKSTIYQLKTQNQTLKLKLKNSLIRISHLYGKLKMFLSQAQINSDAPRVLNEQRMKSDRELYQSMRVKSSEQVQRHSQSVKDLLVQYGCTDEEVNVSRFESEGQVIGYLVKVFNTKAGVLRRYQVQVQEELENSREQIRRLKETVRQLGEVNEQVKAREVKYRERLEEVREEWVRMEQATARKQMQYKSIQSQTQYHHKRIQDLQHQLRRSLTPHPNSQSQHLKKQLHQLLQKSTQLQLKYQQACSILQQTQLAIEQNDVRQKMRKDEFERVSREAVRWRERYERLERKRGEGEAVVEVMNVDEEFGLEAQLTFNPKAVSPMKRFMQESDMEQPVNRHYHLKERSKSRKKLIEQSPQPKTPKEYSLTKIQEQKSKKVKPNKSQQCLQDIIRNFESSLSRVKQKYPQSS